MGNQGPVPTHGMPGDTSSRGVHREQAGDEVRQLLRHVIIHPRFRICVCRDIYYAKYYGKGGGEMIKMHNIYPCVCVNLNN